MKICFLALDYPSVSGGGGVGNQVRTMGRFLTQTGHQITVVSFTEGGSPSFEDDGGIQVHRVRLGNFHWYMSKMPWTGPIVASAVRELEQAWAVYKVMSRLQTNQTFDVIEGTEHGSLLVALLMKNLPLVIRLHGERYTFHKYTPDLPLTLAIRLTRVLQRIALRRAQVLISPSVAHAREVAMELRGKQPPITVIFNSLPPSFQVSRELGDRSAPRHTHPVVLYVGRLERLKGIPLLLEAARTVTATYPNAQFVLAGAHHPTLAADAIHSAIDGLSLQANVHLMGHVVWEQLANWYERADVCVLPSYYESFGVAALEPMAVGVPVVATTAGGLPEVVLDGVTGLLVSPGDSKALSEAVIRLLDDEELRLRLGRAGRERARSDFDLERCMKANIATYRQVANLPLRGEHDTHVFLSPHFDDVVLSCGGLVASLVDHAEDVRVITVFGEGASSPGPSAFARHLHAKWALADVTTQRSQEDQSAMQALGVRQFETWEFVEAPYRVDRDGRPLYVTYTALAGELAREDDELLDALTAKLDRYLTSVQDAQVYVPLSLGGHVDHRLLCQLGLRLQASGRSVRFYEDWPYAEQHTPRRQPSQWVSQIANVDMNVKVRAAQQYASQVHGLGGSVDALAKRLTRYGHTTARRDQERYWSLLPSVGGAPVDQHIPLTLPLERRRPRNLSIRSIARLVRSPDVRESLPVGKGLCIVWGAEAPAFRRAVEERGYHWLGMNPEEPCDGSDFRLPTLTGSASMVVVLDLQTIPAGISAVICESRRVLQPGGIIYLRASGLRASEPLWPRWCMFDGSIASTLARHGFEDMRISQSLSGWRQQPGLITVSETAMKSNRTTHVKRLTLRILYVARKGRDTATCTLVS